MVLYCFFAALHKTTAIACSLKAKARRSPHHSTCQTAIAYLRKKQDNAIAYPSNYPEQF
jgi:hypothetical protein